MQAPTPNRRSWLASLRCYLDKRLIGVFVFGMSSGFPWVLIGSNMSGWLKDAGLTRSAIGLFGSIFAVYSVNFLWAPLVDRLRIPWLNHVLGRRKSWIVMMQTVILLSCIGISLTNPAQSLVWTSLLALTIAIASATQDIAIDGYRIDVIGSHHDLVPVAASVAVAGWWTGYSIPGYIAFSSADTLQWNVTYVTMAALMALLAFAGLWVIRESQPDPSTYDVPKRENTALQKLLHFASWVRSTALEPFTEFFRRCGWQMALGVLLFVFLFKIGEAFLGRMSIVFYREIGFSNEEIATYSKLIGWMVTVAFTLIGGFVNMKLGIIKGLLIGGIAMAASNLMFAWIAWVGPSTNLFLATIIVDNFTSAFSTVAFVSFITTLTGRAFSATQYALLASLGTFGRTTMASFSGVLMDGWLNGQWALFFVITFLMVIPSLLLLLWISRLQRRNITFA